ncbi:DUF6243 family protein [Streptomyces turgidiscabies]|uniref:Uncharacterized protein n=1 Tax=Streptomyces turgidiscabies (strain Car8) TaxID=698760 RepID=L7FEV3_STRT8|nr:DUF6243 family protein [Streptomyces turgidiscabies]ELP69200.1 hypothetical protein STRTUCAR8_03190 [Streptomyces turgidiscabies Car8]MDX3494434.1 DUF6243 family protein [Streptomyces turgidiscabies]GAQ74714.1 hypothetical protein T45_06494 [Streptomyces turgidiscabies]
MSRGGGDMLGVGGTRSNLGRNALRGGGRGRRVGGGIDPQAQKRELLRKLQEKRAEEEGLREAGSSDGADWGPDDT